jgi:uncharacterized protein YciI
VAGLLALAATLFAQDARTVYVALLTRGPSWTADASPALEQLLRDHGAYLDSLSTSHKALVSGPVGDDGPLRGVTMLAAASLEEARTLESADPAVKAGRLTADVFPCEIASGTFTFTPKPDPATRQFALAVLSAGAAGTAAVDQAATRQAHDEFLAKLRDSGVLVMACTFSDAGDRRQMLVFAADAPAGARALMTADPMVAGGLLTFDVHPWFAGDGVMRAAK